MTLPPDDYKKTSGIIQLQSDELVSSSSDDNLSMLATSGEHWMITDINRVYAACPTYPKILAIPAGMTPYELKSCFDFRSKGRIPALSW